MPEFEPQERSHEELADLAAQFQEVLGDGTEADVQRFLKDKDRMIAVIQPFCDHLLIREFQLGSEFRADYVLLSRGTNDLTVHVELIEFESPQHPLFTASGDASRQLNHAIRQLRDWKAWIRDNRAYFLKQLAKAYKGVFSMDCHWGAAESYRIVIGRRSGMTVDQQKQLRALNQEDGHRIMTYDTLLEKYTEVASRYIDWTQRDRG